MLTNKIILHYLKSNYWDDSTLKYNLQEVISFKPDPYDNDYITVLIRQFNQDKPVNIKLYLEPIKRHISRNRELIIKKILND